MLSECTIFSPDSKIFCAHQPSRDLIQFIYAANVFGSQNFVSLKIFQAKIFPRIFSACALRSVPDSAMNTSVTLAQTIRFHNRGLAQRLHDMIASTCF
jgi:hypothetical protein